MPRKLYIVISTVKFQAEIKLSRIHTVNVYIKKIKQNKQDQQKNPCQFTENPETLQYFFFYSPFSCNKNKLMIKSTSTYYIV